MQNFNKNHLLSFTLQSGVAMTDHFIQISVTQFLKPPENSEPKNISPQDLLPSNTNFYSQFLLLGGLRNQDSTVRALLLSSNDNLFFFYQVKKKGKRKVIGVLDIYGFEIFKVLKVYAQDKICLCPAFPPFQSWTQNFILLL